MIASIPDTTRREPYIWTCELSHDQRKKISAIESKHQELPEDIQRLSRYCRCQLRRSDRAYNVYHGFDGIWNGKPASFHPVLRPTSVKYAERLYMQALRDLHAHYSGFDQHKFIDGDRLGERRIIFPDKLDEAAICWIRTRIWLLHEQSDIAVSESFKWWEEPSTTEGVTKIKFELSLNRPVMDKTTWEEISAVIKEGRVFPISTEHSKADWAVVLEQLADLSLPELVLLNWKEARRPLSELDEQLMIAVKDFDVSGMQAALEAGADPNCIDSCNNTPLKNIIDIWGRLEDIEYTKEQGLDVSHYPSAEGLVSVIEMFVKYGVDVNMSPPDTSNALDAACMVADAKIVSLLLDHGADPHIECYTDEYPSRWGSAWESADFRCNPLLDRHDDSAWKVLVGRFRMPFDRVRLSDNPIPPLRPLVHTPIEEGERE
jgi:hypothetical protein